MFVCQLLCRVNLDLNLPSKINSYMHMKDKFTSDIPMKPVCLSLFVFIYHFNMSLFIDLSVCLCLFLSLYPFVYPSFFY